MVSEYMAPLKVQDCTLTLGWPLAMPVASNSNTSGTSGKIM
jgi:hypothetical protein